VCVCDASSPFLLFLFLFGDAWIVNLVVREFQFVLLIACVLCVIVRL